MHCVDDVCGIRVRVDGRSRSSPSDREAIFNYSFFLNSKLAEDNRGFAG
jgi:hypothetical protein